VKRDPTRLRGGEAAEVKDRRGLTREECSVRAAEGGQLRPKKKDLTSTQKTDMIKASQGDQSTEIADKGPPNNGQTLRGGTLGHTKNRTMRRKKRPSSLDSMPGASPVIDTCQSGPWPFISRNNNTLLKCQEEAIVEKKGTRCLFP